MRRNGITTLWYLSGPMQNSGILRKIYYSLSPGLRLLLRRCYFSPGDLTRKIRNKRELIPPRGLIFTGSGDYLEVGRKYLDYFITLAGLQPHHHVIDIGSGIGRMAVALTGYLDTAAKYDGFDIVPQGVRWCQKHISSKYPSFQFRHVHLSNDLYTDTGNDAVHFIFPYQDNAYDFALVISVFTHMVRVEVENYLRELHRTLKEQGTVFVTFFLLNSVSREMMKDSVFKFDFPSEGCYLMDPVVKSANVAYDEAELDALLQHTGFLVKKKFYGTWSGRNQDVLDFQDILVLQKNS